MKNYTTAELIKKIKEDEGVNVSRSTLIRWIQAGRFPGTRRPTKEYLIPESAYQTWRSAIRNVGRNPKGESDG